MFKKFLVGADTPLTDSRILQILSTFQTTDLPKLKKLKDYYDGKQNIVYKQPVDEGRPNNIVIVNYCKHICDTYNGYITGKPIAFAGDGIEPIMDIFNYNDSRAFFAEYLRQALIYGRAFSVNYIDEDGEQRMAVLDAKECIPVYADTIEGELKYVIRFWEDTSKGELATDTIYRVEVYGPDSVDYYTSGMGFASLTPTGSNPNYFGQCAVTVFHLNADETGIFAPIMTLQDAVNTLMSGELDSFADWADAYLVLQGMTADADDLAAMKKARCILLDGEEHCSASFLTKNVTDTAVKDSLETLNTKIYAIAECPDFADPQTFGSATSGVALRYKLLGMETNASSIEGEMRQAIQRIIELINSILKLYDDEVWRDVEIIFTRNIPVDTQDAINLVTALRGIVSQETLLAQLPFVDDPIEELKKVRAEEEANLSLFGGMNE